MKKRWILLLAFLVGGFIYLQEPVLFSKTVKEYDKINISFIDVGQGDSILIDGKKDLLIDCGDSEHGQGVVDYLNSQNIKELEYLVVSHTDEDHMGGCEKVISSFSVKNVMLDGQERNTTSYKNLINLIDTENEIIPKMNYKFNLSGVKFKVVHANINSKDPNQNSIVLRMDYNDFSALFTGDCDRNCEEDLLNENIDVDILKVAHHCSKYGTSTSFLDKVTPEIAVIEVGDGNRFGHPNQECLNRLKNIKIYRTDSYGDIIIESNGISYSIK